MNTIKKLVAGPAMAFAMLGGMLFAHLAAHADPNPMCTPPQWVTHWGVPIASRITCFNPDGSYQEVRP
jgi:hypothetical protein